MRAKFHRAPRKFARRGESSVVGALRVQPRFPSDHGILFARQAKKIREHKERYSIMYKKVDTSLNFVEREKEVIAFWKENGVFEKSIEKNKGGKEFSFFDGPPTANGKPHIGHILTRVMKDIVPRFQTMKGKHVLRKAGWDTHGLPVELEVEKTLGMDGKQYIEKYGIEPFVSEFKKSVWKYQSDW